MRGTELKVGILTFNFALNYGSLLQSYAMQEILKSMGYDAYIVDLDELNKENRLSVKAKLRKILVETSSRFGFIPVIRDRNNKVKKFQNFRKRFHFTSKCNDIDSLQAIADEFDALIVGSDQVWNPGLQDFTYLFMLPVNGVKKIGYSISLGKAKEEELDEFKKDIRDFDSISVREADIKDVVERLSGKNVSVTLDPTLILDKTVWTKLAEESAIELNRPYLLCFLFGKNREFNKEKYAFVNCVAKKKGIDIIYLNHGYNRYSFGNNAYCDCGIEDFLKLFINADAIVTDSFHGTVFSIVFEKEFYSIVDGTSSDRRKQDLLAAAGIDTRIVDVSSNNLTVDDMNIDYSLVSKRLELMKDESIGFLKSRIG